MSTTPTPRRTVTPAPDRQLWARSIANNAAMLLADVEHDNHADALETIALLKVQLDHVAGAHPGLGRAVHPSVRATCSAFSRANRTTPRRETSTP